MNTAKSGTITWRKQYDEITSRLTIQVVFNESEQYLYLSYNCNDNSHYYKIQLTSIPSNLGKGVVWYFNCPFTWKRCRKLHLLDERFMHRSALPSGMYECQTQSKRWRLMNKAFGAYFDADNLYEQLYSKHFKKFYAGKPTKKYLKILRQLQKVEQISPREIERLFIR